ncbi:MAG: transglycosylase SLT domain-containing protein [Myxococcota bacterium]|nr:transglycosylase SLT domain-containing protein [Myxococcota bacterium]
MRRINPSTLMVRRLALIVLVMLTGLLMSARSREARSGPGGVGNAGVVSEAAAQAKAAELEPVSGTGPSVAEYAEHVIEYSNPSLSAHERGRIGAAVERYSAAYSLDPDLVLGVILVESNARPWAHSPKGAVGLMQVMPYMMEPLDLAGNFATIESNIAAGCFILAHNIGRLGFEDGISAYFWGSEIRDRTYLEKVLEARQRVRRRRTS